jgi:hypothetical protein
MNIFFFDLFKNNRKGFCNKKKHEMRWQRGFPRPWPGYRSALWGPINAVSSGTWSPLEHVSTSTAIGSASNVFCPLPLKLSNSSGYVGHFGSSADPLISDSIPQSNSEHSCRHCPLDDLEHFYDVHCERPHLSSICHHWQHTLVEDVRLETLRYSGCEDVP